MRQRANHAAIAKSRKTDMLTEQTVTAHSCLSCSRCILASFLDDHYLSEFVDGRVASEAYARALMTLH